MITKPTLLIDEQKCRTNIHAMAEKAAARGLVFRPHFKTHQSHQVGKWFREAGVTKITVSSLEMASYFANNDWKDITLAFPVNILEIETIKDLSAKITLNLLVESMEVVRFLEKGLSQDINLFIKLDIGMHRTGIDANNLDEIFSLINAIDQSTKLNFVGFLTHAGHSYSSRGKEEIVSIHSKAQACLKQIRNQFPEVFISYGDTPTSSIAEDFSFIDEIRPGNFVFYDLMMVQIGACQNDQIAVAMACPVVAKHPERNEIVVYGGGVHFSKDQLKEYSILYGKVVTNVEEKWGDPLRDILLTRLSQEHGIIKGSDEWIDSIQIGDVVKILPVHSCMTMDLMRHQNVVIV